MLFAYYYKWRQPVFFCLEHARLVTHNFLSINPCWSSDIFLIVLGMLKCKIISNDLEKLHSIEIVLQLFTDIIIPFFKIWQTQTSSKHKEWLSIWSRRLMYVLCIFKFLYLDGGEEHIFYSKIFWTWMLSRQMRKRNFCLVGACFLLQNLLMLS